MLYESHAGEVSGFLRARGTPEPDEVVNDTFLAVFTGLGRFVGDASAFRAWVFQIARHKRVDALRRGARRPDTVETRDVPDGMAGGDVEEDALAYLEDDEVRELLEPLTVDQRDVLLLRVVADLSLDQTALALGKPVGAVKALQHRALAQLRGKFLAGRVPERPSERSGG